MHIPGYTVKKEPLDKFIGDGFNHLLKPGKCGIGATLHFLWFDANTLKVCSLSWLILAGCTSVSYFQIYIIWFYFVNSISLKTFSFWTHLLFAFVYYRYGQFYANLFCFINHELFLCCLLSWLPWATSQFSLFSLYTLLFYPFSFLFFLTYIHFALKRGGRISICICAQIKWD